MNFKIFRDFAHEFNSVIHRLEESMSDASHRSLGGFRTEDQKFASDQYELIQYVLKFLDDFGDQIRQFETTIEEQQFQIDDSANRLTEISEHIKDLRRLRFIDDIINAE